MSIEFILRIIGMIVLSVIGWRAGIWIAGDNADQLLVNVLILSLSGAALGLLLTPYFTIVPYKWTRKKIKQVPAPKLLAGTLGLVGGLVIAIFFSIPLAFLPSPLREILPVSIALLLAYLGTTIMIMRAGDIFSLLGSRINPGLAMAASAGSGYVLLDTSVIIDGRIADISKTGFIFGTMLIPRFVLNELQHIADSPDVLRRNRGRRGLDMLNKLQEESIAPIEIVDMDVEDVREVDSKLIKLGKKLDAPVVTNDYNLNRVAKLQGVTVLNVNELANAVKTIVLPGETMRVHLIQEGKELGQGVGYLDDGTMVVVEGGRRHLNSSVNVTVTRVLQTEKGRMIFAQP